MLPQKQFKKGDGFKANEILERSQNVCIEKKRDFTLKKALLFSQ